MFGEEGKSMGPFKGLVEDMDQKFPMHKKGFNPFEAQVFQITVLENDISGPFQLWHFMIQLDRSEMENKGEKNGEGGMWQ